ALPGLLKELKDKDFHIVQVVPAASYVIAMANKPKAPAQAEAKEPSPAKSQALASRKHKFAGRSQKRKERIAHAGKDERRAGNTHRHKRTHPGADGQHDKRAAQRMMRISMDFQVDRKTPRSGRGGRRFKSCHSDQQLSKLCLQSGTTSGTDTTTDL